MNRLFCVFGMLLSLNAIAQISLDAPGSVAAGSSLEIKWTAGGAGGDFITIVADGAAEGSYNTYKYAKNKLWKTLAPEVAGTYEIRYLAAAAPYATLARKTLVVTPVSATLEMAARVAAGAAFPVSWNGPGNERDFITIVKAGTAEHKYGKYVYTRKGNPVTLTAPEEGGAYEVRYLTGVKYFTLARVPFQVDAVTATVKVPDHVPAGSMVSVEWTGPDNAMDYLTIVPAGAPAKSYGRYVYSRKGSPLELPVPEEPGAYEVRYQTGKAQYTLASAPLTVDPVGAELTAPPQVQAGDSFSVAWVGPGNRYDFIALTPLGAPERSWPIYRYTQLGNPSQLTAPFQAGDYELRYVTGQKNSVLASRPLRVTPAPVEPGRLKVAAASSGTVTLSADSAVELILDASGSMLQRLEGKRRIEVAKDALVDLVDKTLAPGTPLALRVFGHREANACRSDLELALTPLNVAKTVALIQQIKAMNLAKTPIAGSLEKVASDLSGVRGQRVVILITDGEETCEGDPAEAIRELKAAGLDLRLNIVGFAVDDADLKQTFRLWAELGGGRYFDAADASALGDSLSSSLQMPFDVLGPQNEVVAAGLVGAEPVTLRPGSYRIVTRESTPRTIGNAQVTPGETTTLLWENP